MSTTLDRLAVGALEQLAESAVNRARQLDRPVLLTQSESLDFVPDPVAFLEQGSKILGDGVFWSQPQTGERFSGAGAALEIVAEGFSRFGTVTSAIRDTYETIVGLDAGESFPLLGGFAFEAAAVRSPTWDDFPAGRLIVPWVVLQVTPARTLIRVTELVRHYDQPDDVAHLLLNRLIQSRAWCKERQSGIPSVSSVVHRVSSDRANWESSVATAISLIRQHAFDKVVLAREVRLLAREPFEPTVALARLRDSDPAATLFAMQSGRSWFIGATPERLVRLTDGRVEVTCLAGSIGAGESELEKHELALRLLTSQKDREEHEIVVRSTVAILEELCDNVSREEGTPRVASSRTVQHLETPVVGRFVSEGGILDLVERLHPTPAVGGYPLEPSLNAIRELEDIDRGWYAGPFGWTSLDGSGEFAVAIRSAQLSGRTATLFAGSGIVADSVPADEFNETELKLLPMLSALGAS